MKYFRRADLTGETRLSLAIQAYWNQGQYGSITHLAEFYRVSRKFVYQQLSILQLVFLFETTRLATPTVSFPADIFVDQMILLLRLEGKCSLPRISNILAALNLTPHSIGTISQRLCHYAQKLSNTLSSETVQMVLFLSDEIFAGCRPILLTIEPRSAAILHIELAPDRQADRWKEHWTLIEQNQFYAIGLCSDRGTGLQAGFAEFKVDGVHYYDLFHDLRALAHASLVHLENAAYQAIAEEYRRWEALDSARSERVINQRLAAYEQAALKARQAIERYETARQLFRHIQDELEIFDEFGRPHDRAQAQRAIEADLEKLIALNDDKVTPAAQQFQEHLPSLLQFLERAAQVTAEISLIFKNPDACQAICLAWQWNNKSCQAKSAAAKVHTQSESAFWLNYAEGLANLAEDEFEAGKQKAFAQLDTIVRSSALVEMVNSLIRPYLNTCKGNIAQDTLNLIMFYHNHRPFNTGKRKGKSPREILTGKKQSQHWLQLLISMTA